MIIQKIDLSLSENLRLAPVYNKKWIKYQRTERNGYVSLMIPAGRYPRYEVLNATTINILQLMTGNKKNFYYHARNR